MNRQGSNRRGSNRALFRTRFRPAAPTGALLAASLLLTGCTPPRPEVTFFGHRTAVTAEAAFWCDVDAAALTVACPPIPDTGKEAHLLLGPARPLQINVPSAIADGPWLVVYEYRDAGGTPQNGRTQLFSDGRLAYTLSSFGPGTQLTRVEIQAGFVPTLDAEGVTSISASHTWVLVVDPQQQPAG